MAKLVFGMMQSLDGYVAGAAGGPQLPRSGDQLHRHFSDVVRELTGSIYGRRMYEVMRYWDADQPDWDSVERDFAAAWRAKPKWVVSRTLGSVTRLDRRVSPLLPTVHPRGWQAVLLRSSAATSPPRHGIRW